MIKWGIIGAGDVAEVKSGPAFNLVKNSSLLAVMRRNAEKAEDFAYRHHVPLWYDCVEALLENPQINSVYIATPPSSHLLIAKQALLAGKNVYLEKPMTLNLTQAMELSNFVQAKHKLVVAHYRRKMQAFQKVKQLLDANTIGKVLHAKIEILQADKGDVITTTEDQWRLNPSISGGGYFNDIAPHQLDLMRMYFGEVSASKGFSTATKNDGVDNIVNGVIEFESGVQFQGIWNFTVAKDQQKDECVIFGEQGSITFSFYGNKVILKKGTQVEEFLFETPKHVQQSMIESTVQYFMNQNENPCTVNDGLATLKIIDSFTNA